MGSTENQLIQDVSVLKGIGEKTKKNLNKIGIYTTQDILFHLPIRYQDRTRLVPIGSILPGKDYLIEGTIELNQIKYGRRRSLLCQVADGTGTLVLRFFYFGKSQQNNLQRGTTVRCYGTVRQAGVHPEMIHPEFQIIRDSEIVEVDETLTPVYPTTDGLHQAKFRQITDQALTILEKDSETIELLPENICKKYHMGSLVDALLYVHRPPPDASLEELRSGTHPAQQRLVFEELISHNLSLIHRRNLFQKKQSYKIKYSESLLDSFLSNLPFELTHAQQRVNNDIQTDLQNTEPMLRLLQGDVGSGKTVVAAIACLKVISSGFQVALMAPTEILAEQHLESFSEWFGTMGIDIVKLTGRQNREEYSDAIENIREDKPCLIIGTHALFQEGVQFGKLGLVIIDEQHRFGVQQRLSLINKNRDKNFYPHQLVMSATPIPRTLTMTAYGDLDVSIIDEMPPDRKPVNTSILSNAKREKLIERIHQTAGAGRQIYWVCAMIDESETLQCEAAIDTQRNLQAALPDLQIGLIHGKLKKDEKESAMSSFKNKQTDLLVATTVIEVGVNVPNANLMVIENAERLGLAQLHQLRGRVGRGKQQSDCILLYQSPLSDIAKKRLDAIRQFSDGFKIAEIDLSLRGPGELLGTKQSGLPNLSIADLIRDADIIPDAREAADEIYIDYPFLIEKLESRWRSLTDDYSKV